VKATLEVVILPVSDVDKALAFYREKVGFTLDVDYAPTADFRVVQLTPPGSDTSIQFGIGLTDAPPGSVRGLHLVVDGQWHGRFRLGADPQKADYASFADFTDPDGNTWVLQERGKRND
jgi:catechol 2,3-dioxygenase-like lactoylglutathione lyase family enzyme